MELPKAGVVDPNDGVDIPKPVPPNGEGAPPKGWLLPNADDDAPNAGVGEEPKREGADVAPKAGMAACCTGGPNAPAAVACWPFTPACSRIRLQSRARRAKWGQADVDIDNQEVAACLIVFPAQLLRRLIFIRFHGADVAEIGHCFAACSCLSPVCFLCLLKGQGPCTIGNSAAKWTGTSTKT